MYLYRYHFSLNYVLYRCMEPEGIGGFVSSCPCWEDQDTRVGGAIFLKILLITDELIPTVL